MKPRKSVPIAHDAEYVKEYLDEEISGKSAKEVKEKLRRLKKW